MSALLFRAANAADADAVVHLLYEASTALVDYAFRFGDESPEAFLRYDFLRGAGLFGSAQQVVGVAEDGRVVVSATAYQGNRARRLMLATLGSAQRFYGVLRLAAVVRRSLAMSSLFIPPDPSGLFVANVCVDEGQRGSGACSALVDHLARSAREQHLCALELDVSFPDAHAQAVYTHLGFVVTGERPSRRAGLDGFRRMRQEL